MKFCSLVTRYYSEKTVPEVVDVRDLGNVKEAEDATVLIKRHEESGRFLLLWDLDRGDIGHLKVESISSFRRGRWSACDLFNSVDNLSLIVKDIDLHLAELGHLVELEALISVVLRFFFSPWVVWFPKHFCNPQDS